MINFTIKTNQKNLIRFLFQINSNKENINIINEYYKYTKILLKLNSKKISKIKTDTLGKIRDFTIL